MDSTAELIAELKSLRKGRGVYSPDVMARIGPHLRAVCQISDRDGAAAIRQKLIERLSVFARALPVDLELAATAALAVHPDARHAFLTDRIGWLAARLSRDDRTARRRMDVGIEQLAEVAGRRSSAPSPSGSPPAEWHVEELTAVVSLDRSSPQAVEIRKIVAGVDGLDRLSISMSLPRGAPAPETGHGLLAEVLYGGVLVATGRPTATRFDYELWLPRPMRAGERHEFGLVFRIPESQVMRTHYVHAPLRRCDFFDLRVRFGLDRLPAAVWRVDGLLHRELDEQERGETLTLDRAGELRLTFTDPAPGRCYGVQWTDRAAPRRARDHVQRTP